MPGQSLPILLALVASKKMDVEALRTRAILNPSAFADLMSWLKQEHLVEVATPPGEDKTRERVELSDRGEAVLVSFLERTCELPELL